MERIHLLGNGGAGRGWAGCWFQRRLEARRLRPVCQISYQRTARVALTDYGPIRLTLDQGIEAVPAVGMAFSERSCGANFLNDHIILELKFRCDLPSMFKLLIEEFALGPQPVSKYRMASVALGLATPGAELSVEKPASIGDLSGGGGQSAGSDTASGNGNFTTTALAI